MEDTVNYCKKLIHPSRLLGFMTAPWLPTMKTCLDRQMEAINQVNKAINQYK